MQASKNPLINRFEDSTCVEKASIELFQLFFLNASIDSGGIPDFFVEEVGKSSITSSNTSVQGYKMATLYI